MICLDPGNPDIMKWHYWLDSFVYGSPNKGGFAAGTPEYSLRHMLMQVGNGVSDSDIIAIKTFLEAQIRYDHNWSSSKYITSFYNNITAYHTFSLQALRARAISRVDPGDTVIISQSGEVTRAIQAKRDPYVETPAWAKKNPNECPCGIHRAQCDYHRSP
jgi:hypothetical protein